MKLVPKSAARASDYLDGSWRSYAGEVAKGHGLELEVALGKTRKLFDSILPDGSATPGHDFFDLGEEDSVGSLWVAERDGDLFIYDIVIDEKQRGRGLGTAAMQAVEKLARERGCAGIGLSVFAHNQGAIRLYERLGYEVVETAKAGQRMRKSV